MSKQHATPFFLLVVSIFTLVFGFNLWAKGLFVDGIYYGAIAQNLMDGYGSWWQLSPTTHYKDPFFGHPPLGIWMLSYFMQFFERAFWVERLFSLFNLILLLWGMAKLWTLTAKPASILSTWWVWLLWLCIPINTWSFQQNMLENPMTVFIVWSVYWSLRAVETKRLWRLLLGGFFIFLATLTKGPVGLFPLAVIGIYWLVFRKISFWKAVGGTLMLLISLVGSYAALIEYSEAGKHYLSQYLHIQVYNSLTDTAPPIIEHFSILKTFFTEPLALWIGILLLVLKRFWSTSKTPIPKWFFFFLLLTLAGSLPILISPKQMSFYIVPSLPFLALTVAHLSYPLLQQGIAKIYRYQFWQRPLKYSALILIIVSINLSIANYGTFSRDQSIIEDITTLSKVIPPYSKAIILTKEYPYGTECYFVRIGQIYVNVFRWQKSNEEERKNRTRYLVIEKDYRKKFHLYKKNPAVKLNNWYYFELKPPKKKKKK